MTDQWLEECDIEKFHIDQQENPIITVIVRSQTTDLAEDELKNYHDDHQKTYAIRQKLHENFPHIPAAVDIPKPRMSCGLFVTHFIVL